MSLYSSDGVNANATILKRFYGAGVPTNFASAGALLTFSADDGVNGSELWSTDGTSNGTALIKGVCSANPTFASVI